MNFMYLYPKNTYRFDNNGLGPLHECRSATAKEKLNDEFSITFEYPANGDLEISVGQIVLAKVRKNKGYHPFVIEGIDKEADGIMTVYAQHWSSLLSGVVVPASSQSKIEGVNPNEVVTGMIMSAAMFLPQLSEFRRRTLSPYSCFQYPLNDVGSGRMLFDIDAYGAGETISYFVNDTPTSFRSMLGDEIDGGSLLSVFYGEYEYDPIEMGIPGSTIHFRRRRGSDKTRDIILEYGVNIDNFQLKEDYGDVYTSLIPYYKKGNDPIIFGDIKASEKRLPFSKIMFADVSSYLDDVSGTPTTAQITEAGEKAFSELKVDEPDITLNIKSDLFGDDDVDIGDSITVRHLQYGFDSEVRCISYTSDILNEKILDMEFTNEDLSYRAQRTKQDVISQITKTTTDSGSGSSKPKKVSTVYNKTYSLDRLKLRVDELS